MNGILMIKTIWMGLFLLLMTTQVWASGTELSGSLFESEARIAGTRDANCLTSEVGERCPFCTANLQKRVFTDPPQQLPVSKLNIKPGDLTPATH